MASEQSSWNKFRETQNQRVLESGRFAVVDSNGVERARFRSIYPAQAMAEGIEGATVVEVSR